MPDENGQAQAQELVEQLLADVDDGQDGGLTARQEKALAALLESPSIRSAARLAGCNERTLRRYLEDRDFELAYRNARRQITTTAIGLLQKVARDAVVSLQKNLNCGKPAAEIAAAKVILEWTFKGTDLDAW
jgi:hypothetical protein